MVELIISDLSVVKAGQPLVSDASFDLKPGELTVLLGPNGAGKTSLLRGILGLSGEVSGHVSHGDQDFFALSPAERARLVGYLPQTTPLAWPQSVSDIIALGRYAHGGRLGRCTEEDQAAIDRAIELCDLAKFADRRADTLSGGEMARVHLARVLAAETPFVVADEPVAALDLSYQFEIMGRLKDLAKSGAGVLVVLHDLSLAARFADRLIWMQAGRIVANGTVEATLTPHRLSELYGMEAVVTGRRVEIVGPVRSESS